MVRHDDDHRGTSQHFGQALSCDGVDSGVGCRRHGLVPLLAKPGDELGSDESGAADDYDLHDVSPFTWLDDQFPPACRAWRSSARNSLISAYGVRSTRPEKLPLALRARAARMKPVHPARASEPPTLMRRTPSAAMLATSSPMSRTTRRLNGFGWTALTSAWISSDFCGPGAKRTSAPAAAYAWRRRTDSWRASGCPTW